MIGGHRGRRVATVSQKTGAVTHAGEAHRDYRRIERDRASYRPSLRSGRR